MEQEVQKDERFKSYQNLLKWDLSLFQLMSNISPFEFESKDQNFNNLFFNGQLEESTLYELTYQSNIEKNQFLNFLISEVLLYKAFQDSSQSAQGQQLPQILLIQNLCQLDLISLLKDLKLRTKLEINPQSESILQKACEDSLQRLQIAQNNSLEDFILSLRQISKILDENKQIKIVIIDSLNSFSISMEKNTNKQPQGEPTPEKNINSLFVGSVQNLNPSYQNKYEKSTHSIYNLKNYQKESDQIIFEILNNLIETYDRVCFILLRKDYYKTKDIIIQSRNQSPNHFGIQFDKIDKISTILDSPTLVGQQFNKQLDIKIKRVNLFLFDNQAIHEEAYSQLVNHQIISKNYEEHVNNFENKIQMANIHLHQFYHKTIKNFDQISFILKKEMKQDQTDFEHIVIYAYKIFLDQVIILAKWSSEEIEQVDSHENNQIQN